MSESEKTPLVSAQYDHSLSGRYDVTDLSPQANDSQGATPGTHTNYGAHHQSSSVDMSQAENGRARAGRGSLSPPFHQPVRSVSLDSSMKHMQITLSWRDLKVRVNTPDDKAGCCRSRSTKTKTILQGVSGIVKPGTLLAILGASGAGKTTLLNVLTGRNIKGLDVSGNIYANGFEIGSGIKEVSAYVQQDDLFISTLTVREQLQFRAVLRMDRHLRNEERLAIVENVISEMGLTKCSDTRIGNAVGSSRGISGGERKRLSFATEALTSPPIMFCDEPTSGLDSFMAQNIISTLQSMASKGHTILCTIHQPSSELFALFNQILVMSEGRVAFNGSSQAALEFFSNQGYPCPNNFNPADHFILTLAIRPGSEDDTKGKSHAICDAFAASKKATDNSDDIEKEVQSAKDRPDDPLLNEVFAGDSRYSSSLLTQIRYLFWRAWITQFRDVMLFRIRFIQSIMVSLVLGLVYLQTTLNQKGVMSINGAIFVLIVQSSFSNMFAVINSFPIELAIFLREYGNSLYGTAVYFVTKTITETPVFFMFSVVFISIAYWMIGLYDTFDAFIWAQLVFFLTAMTAISLGYFISTVSGSVTASLAIAPPILVPFMLFGGLFINNSEIPEYFVWLKYLSWFRYSNEILMVNQWENIGHIPCENKTMPTNMTTPSSMGPRCQFLDGNDVLSYTSFDKDGVNLDMILLCVLLVGFRVLAFIALLVRARRSKE